MITSLIFFNKIFTFWTSFYFISIFPFFKRFIMINLTWFITMPILQAFKTKFMAIINTTNIFIISFFCITFTIRIWTYLIIRIINYLFSFFKYFIFFYNGISFINFFSIKLSPINKSQESFGQIILSIL